MKAENKSNNRAHIIRTLALLTNLCSFIVEDERRLSKHYNRDPEEQCRKIFKKLGFSTAESQNDRIYGVPITGYDYVRSKSLMKRTLAYVYANKTGDYSEDDYTNILSRCGFSESEINKHLAGVLY